MIADTLDTAFAPSWRTLPVSPWRLSGVVVGAAIQDPRLLAALGHGVEAAPYRGAPRAPVLYVKPPHTLGGGGVAAALPAGDEAMEVAATVGLVLGGTASHVNAAEGERHVVAQMLVADLGLSLTQWYRPAARARALDDSCRLGAAVAGPTPEGFTLRTYIDGQLAQTVDTRTYRRQPLQLLADVAAFMTLAAGDVLLIGLPHAPPTARAGQRVRIEGEGLSPLEFTIGAAP